MSNTYQKKKKKKKSEIKSTYISDLKQWFCISLTHIYLCGKSQNYFSSCYKRMFINLQSIYLSIISSEYCTLWLKFNMKHNNLGFDISCSRWTYYYVTSNLSWCTFDKQKSQIHQIIILYQMLPKIDSTEHCKYEK